jgi:hypothetical protein
MPPHQTRGESLSCIRYFDSKEDSSAYAESLRA